MSSPFRSQPVDQFIKGRGPIKPRTAALLLMVAGAVGFIISLVAFGEKVLCLLGSTIVVFGGLAIQLAARRYSGGNEEDDTDSDDQGERSARRSAAPPKPWRGRQSPAQAPAPTTWVTVDRDDQIPANPDYANSPLPPQVGEVFTNLLTQQTIDILRGQGAEVRIDNQREERSILHIVAKTGKEYTILINESAEVMDVSDVRGLYSLMVGMKSEGAILISANSFSTQAIEWAQKRAILLVEGERIEEIEI
jgi:hypothetical protein